MTLKLNQPCGQTRGKKKLSKGRRGRGDEERRRGKKKPTPSRAQLFFLKEEKFRVRSLHNPAPFSGTRGAKGEGCAPPRFVSLRAQLCDIIHFTLLGVLVVVLLLFVGQEGQLNFLFWQAGAETRPEPCCGFHLEHIFLETSPSAAQLTLFPSSLPHLAPFRKPCRARGLELGDAQSLKV